MNDPRQPIESLDSTRRESDFLARLRSGFSNVLPGRSGQVRFEAALSHGRHFGPPRPSARGAAVMALFYRASTGWRLPLLVRPDSASAHAGQIGLPGGVIEKGEHSRQAALRELEEELGIPAEGIEVLGRLSSVYLFATDFGVEPWVGVLDQAPQFIPSPREVSRLIEADWSEIANVSNHGWSSLERRGISFSAPCVRLGDDLIWGATAMILGELLALLGDECRT